MKQNTWIFIVNIKSGFRWLIKAKIRVWVNKISFEGRRKWVTFDKYAYLEIYYFKVSLIIINLRKTHINDKNTSKVIFKY